MIDPSMQLKRSTLLLLLALLAACKQTPPEAAPAVATSSTAASQADSTAPAPAPAVAEQAAATAPAPISNTGPQGNPAAGSGWRYDERAAPAGAVPRASVTSDDGSTQLVFENHPVTGRNAHLALPAEVDCPIGCRVTLRVDGNAADEMRASRPESADVRLNLRDPRGLWNALDGAEVLVVDYPSANGPASLTFPVAGLDLTRMPGWEQ